MVVLNLKRVPNLHKQTQYSDLIWRPPTGPNRFNLLTHFKIFKNEDNNVLIIITALDRTDFTICGLESIGPIRVEGPKGQSPGQEQRPQALLFLVSGGN